MMWIVCLGFCVVLVSGHFGYLVVGSVSVVLYFAGSCVKSVFVVEGLHEYYSIETPKFDFLFKKHPSYLNISFTVVPS